MGFCTEADVEEFFRTVPDLERMLVRSGIILIKYWFSITDDEQNLRFLMRIHDPLKQWKLSPMDLESRRRWELYTKAKEEMLERTTFPRRAGGWSKVSTKSGRDSTASITCCSKFDTGRSTTTRSCCRHASTSRTMRASRCQRTCSCRRCTNARGRGSRALAARSILFAMNVMHEDAGARWRDC